MYVSKFDGSVITGRVASLIPEWWLSNSGQVAQSTPEYSDLDSTIETLRKNQISEYTKLLKTIEVITKIIPYQRVLCIEDCIVTLADEFIRDDIQMSSFKYRGKIKVFGYITNIINRNSNSNLPPFAEIINKINSAILPEIINKDEIKIIHPIAIYYE